MGKHTGKDATCISNVSSGKAWSSQRELPKQHFSRRRNQSAVHRYSRWQSGPQFWLLLLVRPSLLGEEAGREYEHILMNALDKNCQQQR